MTRWIAILGCAFVLAIAAPAGFEANAAKKSKSIACAATAMDGKLTKWRCKAGTKCCFNWMANKGACVAASDICF